MPIDQSLYIFGNSLVNYAEGGTLTNVPVWMNRFAQFDGNSLSVEGGYGFLRNFADAEEPNTDWGFDGVAEVYDSERTSFAEVAFDNVLITPANFIQEQSPDTAYFDGDRSPLEATRQIVDGLTQTQPGARIFIYEGWADMGPFASDGNPNPDQLAAYHAYNTGDYHDWYVSLTEQVQASFPGSEVTLIPVASVLSELLSSQPLSEIPVEDLYVDSAPHGTETIYFLASMTTYAALYGTVPPADFGVPEVIHPEVAINFAEVAQTVASLMQARGFDVTIPPPGQGGAEDFEDFLGDGGGDAPDEAAQDTPAEEPADETPRPEFPEEDTYYPGEAPSIFPDEDVSDPAEEEPPVDPAPVDDWWAEEEGDWSEDPAPDEGPAIGSVEVTHMDGYDIVSRIIEVPEYGLYRFELTADDTATMFINGAQVLTNDGSTPEMSQDTVVELEAGQHAIDIYLSNDTGGEVLILDFGLESELAAAEADDSFLPETEFEDIPEEEAEEDLSFF